LLSALNATDNTPLFDTSKIPEKPVVSPQISDTPSITMPEKTESVLEIPTSQNLSELPEISPIPETSLTSDEPVLSTASISKISEKTEEIIETTPAKGETLPLIPNNEVIVSDTKIDQFPVVPMENVEKHDTPPVPESPKKEASDTKLAQYLQADRVYQEMIRMEGQEKIRLQLAIRYTFVMFAIFLVFAWIVSNRIIMFGFSEFVWLARIRDGLFAFMA
jgi:hypothetical protein